MQVSSDLSVVLNFDPSSSKLLFVVVLPEDTKATFEAATLDEFQPIATYTIKVWAKMSSKFIIGHFSTEPGPQNQFMFGVLNND
jgi:hypothetical protein